MKYAKEGSLINNLKHIVNTKWINRLLILNSIISGLKEMHHLNFIHCDFHHGNILNTLGNLYSISDLGISKPIEYYQLSVKYDKVYGVLPFIAPEILKGEPYTLASDIYSFSIIMWEITSGIPPFNNISHDFSLSLDICKGKHPEIIENTPQCYINLMKRCWNINPLLRPTALEINNIINNW
ncbi:278_t:CDS:1, partial [Funneliformis geosporum]